MSADIRQARRSAGQPHLRRFHQARWDEPVIYELSTPGARGILIPEPEDDVAAAAGVLNS
jgi:glycine dehydrogenase subunit 2